MSSWERPVRGEGRVPQRRKTPSFSSSLLDAIYRSIDDESNGDEDFSLYTETTMRKKQSTTAAVESSANRRRTIVIEKWTEKQRTCPSALLKSTSTSSDSSSGGVFSSSEAESNYRASSSTSSCFTPHRPKPVRTGVCTQSDRSEKPKHEGGGFTKTKLRALKMYGDLKKAKHHPISPGRRIANFLNSLFNAKKEKLCSVDAMEDIRPERKSKSTTASTTCSTASSFSRSCLSKTPSSRGKLSNGMPRSVRFYPVSVIVGEDCRPCGHKRIYEDDPSLMPITATPSLKKELKKDVIDKNSRVKSAVQDLVRGYQVKTVNELKFRDFRREEEEDDDDDDDDDADSCASSDLFELENLIGIGRYREELPVYETTNLRTNQAIANGFIL